MHRLLRLSFLVVLLSVLSLAEGWSQEKPQVFVSGRIAPENVRIFLKDSVYIVNRDLIVGGTLIIEPGTTVYFYEAGRLIDSCGGRIIADGNAQADYNANPTLPDGNQFFPTYPIGLNNPKDLQGYSDLRYFLFGLPYRAGTAGNALKKTINVKTSRDVTIHADKDHHIFNVVLNLTTRNLSNLKSPTDVIYATVPADREYSGSGTKAWYVSVGGAPDYNQPVITFEEALIFKAARLEGDPDNDVNLRQNPWSRVYNGITTGSVNVGSATAANGKIKFIGQPMNDFSREWGQIIVLPGARTAFFRNCLFDNFRKDTTVDRTPIYDEKANLAVWGTINNRLRNLTNGSGGVISTFSSRTWILDCDFTNNMARLKGGALQILQAPAGYPKDRGTRPGLVGDGLIADGLRYYDVNSLVLNNRYLVYKNPQINDKDRDYSSINAFYAKDDGTGNPAFDVTTGLPTLPAPADAQVLLNTIPAIDRIDESITYPEPAFQFSLTPDYTKADYYRQAFDDGRIALYLGRMRNMRFTNNKVVLANIAFQASGTPPVLNIVKDDTTNACNYPIEFGDIAYGGAIYMAGSQDNNSTQMEVCFGNNQKIMTGTGNTSITFTVPDQFKANNNYAYNYQQSTNSKGARGGAIYAGKNTSLIITGQLDNNATYAKFLQTFNVSTSNRGFYSMGGAIFAEKTYSRLQVRGGPMRETPLYKNATEFIGNQAGAGGAIYVDDNLSLLNPISSPIIGGSDTTLQQRAYGYNLLFQGNNALSFGGAIFSKRNFTINGDGGIDPKIEASLTGGDTLPPLYGGNYPVKFISNTAGFAGGAIDVRLPLSTELTAASRTIQSVRAEFRGNTVGFGITDTLRNQIRGGGAIYFMNGSLNEIRGTQFLGNTVRNGNGGAIALINPQMTTKRFFVTDVDRITKNSALLPVGYTSMNKAFTFDRATRYVAHSRMMTQFMDNEIVCDSEMVQAWNGTGTTQVGAGVVGTSNNLRSSYFFDDKSGVVVGDGGTVIKVTEGGTKWEFVKNLPNKNNIVKVFFLTRQIGYIVTKSATAGGQIWKTTDGGSSWTATYTAAGTLNVNALTFNGALRGFAVIDGGTVLITDDGGNTWLPTPNKPTSNNIYSVCFSGASQDQIFVVGAFGEIFKTTNAGTDWTKKQSNTISDLFAVYFSNINQGYAIGANGIFLKTVDAGNSWFTNPNISTTSNLRSFYFTDANTFYVIADDGTVYKMTNAGENVQPVNTNIGARRSLSDVFFPTKVTGYVVADEGYLMKSTDSGDSWFKVKLANESKIDARRFHLETSIPENGIGLGGGIYILDKADIDRTSREDTISFNRVRFQNNKSLTGAAIYSDNFDLKLIFSRSLIANNVAKSKVGMNQNAITGPLYTQSSSTFNAASSDLAPAIIYGEIQGPLPATSFSTAANTIMDNSAKFIIRLPDAPNTKGVLAGTTGIGFGGTDTLRGNYWGKSEANVDLLVDNQQSSSYKAKQETFFVDTDGERRLNYLFWETATDRDNLATTQKNLLFQGPFESIGRFDYKPIPLKNGADENTPDVTISIPEKLLQSGRVYDLYDKGTDIKTADYTHRRMSPIEDYSVGIPPILRRFNVAGQPSFGKYVKLYARDPEVTEAANAQDVPMYPLVRTLQTEIQKDLKGKLNVPIGQALYMEARADYDGDVDRSNRDLRSLNETVFFVINEATGDFLRINLKQLSDLKNPELFRNRLDLVPDSTNRNPNTYIRRTMEGLLNLGNGNALLGKLVRDADKEDRGTLVGRKYVTNHTGFAKVANLFNNRPAMPTTNLKQGNNRVTYFSGERFRALPVNVGDSITIISRTVLWHDSVDIALRDGVKFYVAPSTEPSRYTGDVYHLQNDTLFQKNPSNFPWEKSKGVWRNDTITDFMNKVWISEDRIYPAPVYMYSDPVEALRLYDTKTIKTFGTHGPDAAGRDRILNVTANDVNNYYDPRAILDSANYPRLEYTWTVDGNSGLKNWLKAEWIKAADRFVTNPMDGAKGYMLFRGRPSNPYVVPGGEDVNVSVRNFPPHWRTTDDLKNLVNKLPDYRKPSAFEVNQFCNIFQPYLNAPKYDSANARYLNQDTVDCGPIYQNNYSFKLFVVDSVPVFLDPDAVDEDSGDKLWPKDAKVYLDSKNDEQNKEVLGTYNPSIYPCRSRIDGRLVANLTNKLRFQVDINTDDEAEDSWAEAKNWDFRYGRTAYGFLNIALRQNDKDGHGADTTVIDTIKIDKNDFNGQTVLIQQRPSWMDDQFIYKYGSEDTKDEFGTDFMKNGQLNFRIDSALAAKMLTPVTVYDNAKNTDTVFTVVANDGHAGVNSLRLHAFVNFEPKILTTTLAPAKEDVDYNPQLLDSTKMIKVFDENFDQQHWFALAYKDANLDQLPDSIRRDPCFIEAGYHILRSPALGIDLKTTPSWLKINKQSGLLYGTPGVKDAPRKDVPEQVTVVVFDEDSLCAIKTFQLIVDSTNHCPGITATPAVRCIDDGMKYEDRILVYDHDLMRGRVESDPTDTLTLTVLQPSSLKLKVSDGKGGFVEGTTIPGFRANDTAAVIIFADKFTATPEIDGRVTVKLQVTDKAGCSTILEYRLKYSLATDFVCDVTVKNNQSGTQTLQFGTASEATSGEGFDDEAVGHLDEQYCEYELPPIPPTDIFDTRWTISNTNGTYRNFFLTGVENANQRRVYRARVQSGGEAGSTSNHFPIVISWDSDPIPDKDNTKGNNPSKASWWIQDNTSTGTIFNINMKTGDINNLAPDMKFETNGSVYTLTIMRESIEGFNIIHDWTSPVEEETSLVTKINSISPNPLTTSTRIDFSIRNADNVKIEILDQLGRVVNVLKDQKLNAGTYSIEFNGRDMSGKELSSGTYTCRMMAGSITATEKIVIVK